jgi:hypothetical protein
VLVLVVVLVLNLLGFRGEEGFDSPPNDLFLMRREEVPMFPQSFISSL